MPTITVKTHPLPAPVIVFRIAGRYGIMNRGISPVKASRAQPWTWLAAFGPVIDRGGFLWVTQNEQIQGLLEKDGTVHMRYLKVGKYLG